MRYLKSIIPATFIALVFAAIAAGQVDITWTGSGDGSTFSDDGNWNPSVGSQGPEFAFIDDSLKFDSTGTSVDNDLDPAMNGDALLQLGPGSGDEATSAAFHFLAGSGEFTFNGFGVQAGSAGNDGVFRADAGAGMLQTFNIPISLTGGNKRRKVVLSNGGTVVFNGDMSFANSLLFLDEGAGRVELNGNNIGVGTGNITGGTNGSRVMLRNNVANSVISLGSDTALGDVGTGSWDAGDLQMRGFTANQITFLDTDAPRDLSGYFVNLSNASGGGALRFSTPHDVSLGYLIRAGNGTRVAAVENTGVVTIENGIFASGNDVAQIITLLTGGTNGNAEGGNGEMIVNGRLFTTLIDPASASAAGTSATGGISIANQLVGLDGVTPINGGTSLRFGTFRLNGDSSTSWIGSQVTAQAGARVYIGNDGALGDSNSLVGVISGAMLDIGTHTIDQRLARTDGGTVRGNGTLTNELDWSFEGTLQPGGASPVASDAIAFDFSGAAIGNTLQFEANSTIDFVLDAGLTSSTVDVTGSLGGGTSVVFADNAFNFTDLTAGDLGLGDYTLFDGDANTTFSLGAGVSLAGLGDFGGSLSIVGDDLILTLTDSPSGGAGDFNSDGNYDCADVDALVADIATGMNTTSFDLTGDGMVDNDDLISWLGEAGEENLGAGRSYLIGDANLDGVVDTSDFNVWNSNKFTSAPAWCQGDFNADGVVDTSDFNLWNSNKFTSADVAAVPEPGSLSILLLGVCCLFRGMRRGRRFA